MDAVAAITGLKVNYYALIDLKGFQRLINAVGGVTINVKTARAASSSRTW